MYIDNAYKILKYIALVIIIYFSLRVINCKMENIDTLIISLVIATGFAIIENVHGHFFKKPPAFCTGKSCTSPNLKKESFENSSMNLENSSMNLENSTVNTVDNSNVNTVELSTINTVDNSTMNTALSEESYDATVASIISTTVASKPTKITIQSNNGVATTYTQTASGTYAKTTGTSSTSGTNGVTNTASTNGVTNTASTRNAESTSNTASISSNTDYNPIIDIAGVTGKNVIDYGVGNDFNRLPVSALEYDYGYSFMPPKDWFPIPPNPPVCMSDKKCPVCPIYTDGTIIDLKKWDKSPKIA